MTTLEMLKTLLDIELTDISKDNKLNFYLSISRTKISNRQRISITENFDTLYFNGIVKLAEYEFKNSKVTGIKSYTESKRSVTFDKDSNNYIPQDILALLPNPSIVMW